MQTLHLIEYTCAPKAIGHERSNCDEEGGERRKWWKGRVGFASLR